MSRTIIDVIGKEESAKLGSFEEGKLRALGDKVDDFKAGRMGDVSEADFIEQIVREIELNVKTLDPKELDNIRRSLGYKL